MEIQKKYGYVRVSTKEQNEQRQIQALLDVGVESDRIFKDKQSGKDFKRTEYQTLKRMLKDSPNSLLVIKSIDRLGRNYNDIQKEWKELTTEYKADIQVLDMPLLDTRAHKDLLGTFISDLVFQILSFVAEQERTNIKTRQKEGIIVAKARNVKFGRPNVKIPDNFSDVYKRWKSKEITATKAIELTGLKRTTFYKIVKDYEI